MAPSPTGRFHVGGIRTAFIITLLHVNMEEHLSFALKILTKSVTVRHTKMRFMKYLNG